MADEHCPSRDEYINRALAYSTSVGNQSGEVSQVVGETDEVLCDVSWNVHDPPWSADSMKGREGTPLNLSQVLFDHEISLTLTEDNFDMEKTILVPGRTVYHILKAIQTFYLEKSKNFVARYGKPRFSSQITYDHYDEDAWYLEPAVSFQSLSRSQNRASLWIVNRKP